jgi:hypothetical protein
MLAAVESFILLMGFAFNLKVEEIYCRVNIENVHALSFHNAIAYSKIISGNQEILFFLESERWEDFEKAYKLRFGL